MIMQLSEEREQFKSRTVHPIWQLRNDLKQRISELNYHMSHQSQMQHDFDPERIIEEVEFVKEQQQALIEQLSEEQQALEKELKACEAQVLSPLEVVPWALTEIPQVLQEAECPYADLKYSLIREYEQFTEGYLAKLQESSQQTKEMDSNCSWSEEEHWIFHVIINQHPQDLPNRRSIYFDMLSKHLPHKPRQELISHENLYYAHRFTKDQRVALLESWTRYRKDFILKAIMTITEACSAYETEIFLVNDRIKQQEICTELKKKVTQWRAHQEEAARLESSIAAREREQRKQREKHERERDKSRRADEKEKIQKYKAEKQQAWEELQKRDLQRLEQLRKIMAQQAEKDKERVLYRQQLLEKRLLEKKEWAWLEEQEEEERQRRLEALRQQVAVIAEFDPVRMMSDTKASKARLGIGIEEEFLLQRPLFQLHTYSEQQIISDPRIRIEMALREAGLHQTMYAKEILPQISPPKPPRKDMESTVFKK
ncbi:coiled-coil domain-containing protein 148 isoform X2 [Xenopus laevis]|uniref:Coiled-coil domain-containing protein 148 isoform X2 n=1 Tax=Xenopus laevis TaxID=8355 RepID=A0A8J1LWL5_XENLA|nr:coiled-coil domain-containing protein 148 isoform X2 [Xenopus laevis]